MKSIKNRNLLMVCIPLSAFVCVLRNGFIGLAIMWAIIGIIMYRNKKECETEMKNLQHDDTRSFINRYNSPVIKDDRFDAIARQRDLLFKEDQKMSQLKEEGKISFNEYWEYSQKSQKIWKEIIAFEEKLVYGTK